MLELLGFSVPIVYLHLATLLVTGLFILYADHQAFEWVMGHKEKLDQKKIEFVHYATLTGLTLMIITGAAMAIPLKEYLFTLPAYWIKMSFVLALIVNSFFIGKLLHIAIKHPYKTLALSEKIPLFVSGAVSGISWLGAFVAAIFMQFGTLSGIFNSLF